MKRILLVFPRGRKSVWSMDFALNIVARRGFIPPLGLATVAALTPQKYEVRIIDENVEPVDFGWRCDLAGIAGYTFNAPRMLELADEFKKRGVMTVGGGPYCKTHTQECLEHFDTVFAGEVERTWPRFLNDWENGTPARLYEEPEFADMAHSPPPRWDLLDLARYSSGIVQTTRGCVYDCEFCDVVALTGHKPRNKCVAAVVGEVRDLLRRNVSAIWIADDNFTANPAFAKTVLRRLIELNRENGNRARFITQITAEKAEDGELVSLLREAGFYAVLIGIESPNRDSLAETGKHQNLKTSLVDAVRTVQSAGIYVVGGMVVGFDADGKDIFGRHERFIEESGLLLPVISMLKASTGTRLWKRMRETGRLTGADDGDFYSASNFVPAGMTREELEEGYRSLTGRVFSYPHSLRRFERFIAQVRSTPHSRTTLADAAAGLRATAHFLFRSPPEARRFFLQGLKTGLQKGFWGMAAFVELAVWLESHRAFMSRERKAY